MRRLGPVGADLRLSAGFALRAERKAAICLAAAGMSSAGSTVGSSRSAFSRLNTSLVPRTPQRLAAKVAVRPIATSTHSEAQLTNEVDYTLVSFLIYYGLVGMRCREFPRWRGRQYGGETIPFDHNPRPRALSGMPGAGKKYMAIRPNRA